MCFDLKTFSRHIQNDNIPSIHDSGSIVDIKMFPPLGKDPKRKYATWLGNILSITTVIIMLHEMLLNEPRQANLCLRAFRNDEF